MAMVTAAETEGERTLAVLVLALVAGGASAQTTPSAGDAAAASPIVAVPAAAGAGSVRRAWSVVPRLNLVETLTDNVGLDSANRRRDQITEISPGVRVEANTARLRAHLDYQLSELIYGRDSQRNRTQNALNAFGTLEAVDNWLFVEFSGNVAQQGISAFDRQSTSNTSVNANSSETSNFRVSPYVRGRLGSFADYSARYNVAQTRSKAQSVAEPTTQDWSASLDGTAGRSLLSWGFDVSHSEVEYGNQRKTESDRLQARFGYRISDQYRLRANFGRDRNDFQSLDRRSFSTRSIGLDWSPSPRTQVALGRETQFFGTSNNLSITHRMPRSIVTYSQGRSVSVLPNQFASVGRGSLFDLLFNQLASAEPDPVARAAQVNSLLQASGIAPGTQIVGGFLTSRVTIQKRRDLSLALLGVRNTVTLQATQTDSEAASDVLAGLNDDFALTPTIRQRGFSAIWANQLSGFTSMNVSASQQRSSGAAGTGLDTTQRTIGATLSTRLGPYTSAALTTRRTTFDSATAPSRENTTTGSLSIRF